MIDGLEENANMLKIAAKKLGISNYLDYEDLRLIEPLLEEFSLMNISREEGVCNADFKNLIH